ncbi:hypothetical protein AVEN_123515-1 [Araneus ventricosus]|uniref:Uncharacterized protein n=1 Tax=Araneus ventricosus TaxID=182803 RepID=A0A4Y2GPB7_ARAVE|nr:hypothetical protein AVEN_123515-1 [Araneus ventricosus]
MFLSVAKIVQTFVAALHQRRPSGLSLFFLHLLTKPQELFFFPLLLTDTVLTHSPADHRSPPSPSWILRPGAPGKRRRTETVEPCLLFLSHCGVAATLTAASLGRGMWSRPYHAKKGNSCRSS